MVPEKGVEEKHERMKTGTNLRPRALALLGPAGTAMNGMLATSERATWGDASAPDVAAYVKTAQAVGADSSNPSVEMVHLYVEALYTAAKNIGVSKFTSASVAQFMRTANGVDLPVSRSIVNPGPNEYPQLKQPYVQVVRSINGQIVVVMKGHRRQLG
jgi:hypothetical protein